MAIKRLHYVKIIAVVWTRVTKTADKKQLQHFVLPFPSYAFYWVGFKDLSATTITLVAVNVIAHNVHYDRTYNGPVHYTRNCVYGRFSNKSFPNINGWYL